MSRRRTSRQPPVPGRAPRQPTPRGITSRRLTLGLAGLGILAAAVVVVVMTASRPSATIKPLSRLGTADVHSLAFVGNDPQHLLFGHHGGILETLDGGRTWAALAAREDAMGMSSASGGSIIIAGHDVFSASPDGGRTWASITTDLPSRDIHGFARDPADPAHMWAALATGGLWESRDGGAHFVQVSADNVLGPIAMRGPGGTRVVGVGVSGLVASDDGERTWTPLGDPGLYPIVSLAATTDGSVLVAGGPDGLRRSTDGGKTWTNLRFPGAPFAVALANGGQALALVTQTTEFYRSDDGGATWAVP